MSVYCEPHALLHWAIRQEADWRIVWTRCGERIAIIGHPKNKPPNVVRCSECFE